MADKLEILDDLFEMQLKDPYSAENQLVTALKTIPTGKPSSWPPGEP